MTVESFPPNFNENSERADNQQPTKIALISIWLIDNKSVVPKNNNSAQHFETS